MKPAGAYCLKGTNVLVFFNYGPRSLHYRVQCALKNANRCSKVLSCQMDSCVVRAIPLGSGCKSKVLSIRPVLSITVDVTDAVFVQMTMANTNVLPKDTYFWKYLSAFIILASTIVNIAYVAEAVQININPTPGSSFGIFWVASIGSLAILVCYLLGPLTFVAPLATLECSCSLWFSIFTESGASHTRRHYTNCKPFARSRNLS